MFFTGLPFIQLLKHTLHGQVRNMSLQAICDRSLSIHAGQSVNNTYERV